MKLNFKLISPFKNEILDNQFEAHDKDDPSTPNAQVLYEILSIEPGNNVNLQLF